MNGTSENKIDGFGATSSAWLSARQPLLNQLFVDSGAESWGIPRDSFVGVLEQSAQKHFGAPPPAAGHLEAYLSALHLQDLALACACAAGQSNAWEYFVTTYRGYLRTAAGAVLRCPPDSPGACELADSLFGDLYGLGEGPNRRSLFRYFHGRSSLKTWLRAVLAQRHVDAIRAGRRFTEFAGADGHAGSQVLHTAPPRIGVAGGEPRDPHRTELVNLFRHTLEVALGLLDRRDKERLRMYYAAEQTLAEIGRTMGEHESSVSRNLERTRRELRQHVEQALRKTRGSGDGAHFSDGLSDAQIALCLEYAAEDAPIDLDQLLPASPAARSKPESKKS
jgi:RNA polymerase sigma-70 factor (ECF subfamily)